MFRKLRLKYINMPIPMKASFWFVVCGILKDSVDVIVTPIFTRILTTEQYGAFNVYNSWFQIVKIVFTLYLFGEVFNVGLAKYDENRDVFISSTLGFVTTVVFSFFVIYELLGESIDDVIGLPRYLIVFMFAHVLMYVPYYCWLKRERFDYHYKNVVIVSFLYILLQPFFSAVAIIWGNTPVNPGYRRIIAAVMVQVIIGLVLYISMLGRGKRYFHIEYWKYSMKTGIQLIPYNLSKVVLNQSDRIMINNFTGVGDTGIYSVAHSAAFVLQALTEAVDGSFVPWLYRKLNNKDCSGVSHIVNVLLLIVAGGVFAIEVIAPEIMKILGNHAYYKGVYCIPPLVYSVYLIFVYSIFSNIELFFGKNMYVTYVSIVGMATNIILNAVFIPMYGFIAAGYTTLVSYLVICAGHYILLTKCLYKEEISIADLIDIRFFLFVSLVLLLLTLTCEVIYKYFAIRWVLIAIIVAIIIGTKDKWRDMVRELKGEING